MPTTHLHMDIPQDLWAQLEQAAQESGTQTEIFARALVEHGLRERTKKLEALRAHLAEGEAQIAAGQGIENFCVEAFLAQERLRETRQDKRA